MMLNPDSIVSAFYTRIVESGIELASLDKGVKRADKAKNPSGTIYLLTSSIDRETDAVWCTVVIKVYAGDLRTGRIDMKLLGELTEQLSELFHKSHLPIHSSGRIKQTGLTFKSVLVKEVLIGLESEHPNEHLSSIAVRVIVKPKRNIKTVSIFGRAKTDVGLRRY